MYRILSLCLIALALVVFAGAPALADDKDTANTHEGTVVSVTGNQLIMKDKAGKEHTHQLAASADITCDGKTCKLSDLKPGQKIRVTTTKGDEKTATKVEALDKNKNFGSGTSK